MSRSHRMRICLLSLVIGMVFTWFGWSADHPQFGQAWSRNMTSPELGLPQDFNLVTGQNLKWTVPLGTETHSTPVISGGRIYIGTNNEQPRDPRRKGDRGILLCLDEKDGHLLWQLAVPKRVQDPYLDWPKAGISSPATVEGNRVYLVDNRGVVVCLDVKGLKNGNQGPFRNEAAYFTPHDAQGQPAEPQTPLGPLDADILWQFDLTLQAGIWSHDSAHSSILILGDQLYINTGTGVDNTHKKIRTPDAPSLIVLNKKTGQWLAADGQGIAPRVFHCTWSSPSLTQVNGKDLILFAGGDGVVYAFEPWKTSGTKTESREGPGTLKLVWKFDFDPEGPKEDVHRYNSNRSISPSNIYGMPVVADGRVYVAGGGDWFWGKNEAWLKCFDPHGQGDITRSNLLWQAPLGRHTFSTPSVQNGLVVVADSMRQVHCIDAKTGQSVWMQSVDGEVWSSALIADGKIYIGTKRGDFWVFALSREKKVLSHIQLDSGLSATPVAANGTLFIATQTRLHAITHTGSQSANR